MGGRRRKTSKGDAMGRWRGNCIYPRGCEPMECFMHKLNALSRSLTPLEPDGTLIAVIEMSLSSWLVAGIVPGVERQPLKKLEVDESALLKLLNRWREEAEKAGHTIERIAVAFEAGRDGFWLARWLRARDVEAHVVHDSSVVVSREHRHPRPTGSIPSRSDAHFSARCGASVITARWWRSRQSRTKMPNGPTVSARASSETKVGLSTE